ncbi:MAG: AraC family transcriptional regulator [Gemmataceae bacterium]|nr:AraC family transcriptional regulator [Gemmataceae bacterium]
MRTSVLDLSKQVFILVFGRNPMLKKLEPGSYYGTTVHRYDLGGLTLGESVYPPGLVIPPHEHANPFFALLLEGSSTQSCACRTWMSRPFSLIVFPAGLAHANRLHDSGGRVLHVEFARPWLERLPGRTAVLDRPADYAGGPQVWLARRLVDECRWPDDVSPLAVEGLVLELLAECSRSQTESTHLQPPRWLNRVHELLHDRFSENLSLSEVAAAAGISADHLARSFRRCHGCTVGEYVRRLRVEFACRRLAAVEAPLVQVALEAGFTDQSHFTKTFKHHMGMTPAVFKNLHGRRRSCTKE